MLVLCGFPISNYYNKVKLALLEKGVAFSEEDVATGSKDPAVLAASPLAKIPFIRTDAGALCESQPILEYLEDAYPHPPLLPSDPFAAAKVREVVTFIDLHEGVLRRHRQRRQCGPRAPAAGPQRRRLHQARALRPLRGGARVHAGRLRRVGEPARDRDGDQGDLRRRLARRRGLRLEDLPALRGRKAERTARHGGSQSLAGTRRCQSLRPRHAAWVRPAAPPGRQGSLRRRSPGRPQRRARSPLCDSG